MNFLALTTSGAWSINHQWNFSLPRIRFLGKENLLLFLAIRAILIVSVQELEKQDTQNFDDIHLQTFVGSEWNCEYILRKK